MKNSERLYQRKEYPRYSISHIKKQFKKLYNIDVVEINYGYKSNRYMRFNEYNMYKADTGELIASRITVAAMGDMLKRQGDY